MFSLFSFLYKACSRTLSTSKLVMLSSQGNASFLYCWVLFTIYQEALCTFSIQIYQTEIPLWVLFTPSRQGLYSLEPSVHKCRMNRRGRQTNIWLQGKKDVLKSRRERSRAAHLVADGLVLEPRLVQDLLQLLVVAVEHPNGLGQLCILTLLQCLEGRGGEQSLGMGNRTRIKAGKKICKKCHPSRINIDYQEEKRGRHYAKRIIISSLNPGEDISHGRKEIPVCTVPYISSSFPLWNISAMVSSPQPSLTALRLYELLGLMVHSPFSQVKEMKEVPTLLAPPLVSLLPILTSHVWQKSTESNTSFPFSSVCKMSSPGWDGSSHFRDSTK